MSKEKERKRMEYLLEVKKLTSEQFEELEANEFVVETDMLGYSSDHPGYYWCDVRVVQQGYLPTDEDCLTENYNIYVKAETE